MATFTLGTNANNSIPYAATFQPAMADADVATISQHVLFDNNRNLPASFGAFQRLGRLYVPNRGWLSVLPGDVVGVDSRGWPILLSADTIANGLWTT